MVAIALILGLSSVVFAESYSSLMVTAKNSYKAGMFGDALDYAEKALALKQNGDPEAFALIGDIYFAQKAYLMAQKNWQNAVVFKISDPAKFKANIAGKFFALGVNNLGNIQTAKEFFQYAVGFGYSSAEIAKAMKNYGENIIRQAQDREQGLRAVPYVGQARVDAVFPEPKWETVLKKDLTGKGTEGDTAVLIAKFGDDIKLGDKIIMTAPAGKSFFVTDAGNWVKCTERYEVVSQCTGNGLFCLSAEKGMNVTLEIQRLVQPAKRNDLVTLADFSTK